MIANRVLTEIQNKRIPIVDRLGEKDDDREIRRLRAENAIERAKADLHLARKLSGVEFVIAHVGDGNA